MFYVPIFSQSQSSSVIDLDDMELIDNDASDYESDFRGNYFL